MDQVNHLRWPNAIGPVFAKHGYVFLFLFRRGDGLSVGEGENSGDVMDSAFAKRGQQGRNEAQLQILETDQMQDALAGLSFLRSLRDVDPGRIAIVGHSFGGSLTLLLAERDSSLRAAVVFAGAGGSWDTSPPLRARLLAAVRQTTVPVFIIHAANDYSVAAAIALDAEMTRLGKSHRMKIYPAFGPTAEEGHSIVYLAVPKWEDDVFAFLDERTRSPQLPR